MLERKKSKDESDDGGHEVKLVKDKNEKHYEDQSTARKKKREI